MAMKLNPLTGLMEDDGLPEDPTAPPDTAPIAGMSPLMEGPGGGTPPPPAAPPPPVTAPKTPALPPIDSLFPAKPLHESTRASEQRVQSKGDVAAEGALKAAQNETTEASKGVGDVNQQEANVTKDFSDQRAAEKQRQLDQAAEMEAARKQRVEDHIRSDNAEIEQVKKAKLEAGAAREHFWDGNTGAHIFAAVLQGIGEAANAFQGRSGPSPATQIINAKIDAHVQAAVAKYEATAEAHKLKRENRAAYENELDKRKIAAINQNLLSLDLIDEQMKAGIAGLGPAKAAAAQKLVDADKDEARKRQELERAELYDRTSKFSDVNRSESASPAAAARAGEKWIPDPTDPSKRLSTPDVSAEEAAKGRASAGRKNDIEAVTKRIDAFIDKHGVAGNSWDPRTKNQWEALQNEAAGLQAKTNNDGSLKAFNFGKLNEIFGSEGLGNLLQNKEAVREALKEVRQNASDAYLSEAQSLVPEYGRAPQNDNGTGGAQPKNDNGRAAEPSPAEMSAQLQSRTPQQLAALAANPSLPPAAKQAVVNELARRRK